MPVGLTAEHSASGVQPLPDGRVLFTQSSFTSPNNVFLLSGLRSPDKPLDIKRLTSFGHDQLKTKALEEPEELWFKGAGDVMVHGWAIKPPGFKAGHAKKYPVVLLIHGGPQSECYLYTFIACCGISNMTRRLGRSMVYSMEP